MTLLTRMIAASSVVLSVALLFSSPVLAGPGPTPCYGLKGAELMQCLKGGTPASSAEQYPGQAQQSESQAGYKYQQSFQGKSTNQQDPKKASDILKKLK